MYDYEEENVSENSSNAVKMNEARFTKDTRRNPTVHSDNVSSDMLKNEDSIDMNDRYFIASKICI